MPTYFTEPVGYGEITTVKEFLLRCTRGMDIAQGTRDDSDGFLDGRIPMVLAPDLYWKERYAELIKKRDRYELFNLDKWRKMMQSDWEERVSRLKLILTDMQKENQRYEKMLVEVRKWNPPTDEHQDLKKFALSQLHDSIIPQTELDFYEKEINSVPDFSDSGVGAFKIVTMRNLFNDISVAETQLAESRKNAEHNTIWMQRLLESLESL